MTDKHPHRTQYAIDSRQAGQIASQASKGTEHAAARHMVYAALQARICVDAMERSAVRTARAEGWTWAEIGGWLGITRQAAQQRFSE